MSTDNAQDYVIPFSKPLDCFANEGIQRLTKDDLWKLAAERPLFDRTTFVVAVAQYREICTTGSYFQTDDVRSRLVSTQILDIDPSELWCSDYDKGILRPSYTSSDGVKYVPKLHIRSVQEIDTPRSDLLPYRQGFQCPLWVGYSPQQEQQKINCCSGKLDYFRELSATWLKQCTFKRTIWDAFINAGNRRKIDRIVCFGLGTSSAITASSYTLQLQR
jgi:hypothetical protein